MTAKERPSIAITMGDAAGIGPEIIVKALASEQIYNICRPLVVGEGVIMQEAIKMAVRLSEEKRLFDSETAGASYQKQSSERQSKLQKGISLKPAICLTL